jgi:hypothetical protein
MMGWGVTRGEEVDDRRGRQGKERKGKEEVGRCRSSLDERGFGGRFKGVRPVR